MTPLSDVASSTPTVFALSAVLLDMVIIAVYFAIFFMMFYAVAWGLIQFFKPIIKIMNYDGF